MFCCLFSQNINAQCDIGYGGPAIFNLSLDVNGSAVINSNLFEPFVTSSYAQCLPANGADLELWMDAGATTPFPNPSFYDCTNVGDMITVWVTLDDQGPGSQSAAIMFEVTITDDLPPLLAVPGPQSYTADPGACASFQTLTAVVTENCPGSLSTTHTLTGATTGGPFPGLVASHAFDVGTTTITWFAVDGGPNPVTMTTTVTVSDDEPPTYQSTIGNATFSANGSCQASRTWTHPLVSDNCGISTYTLTFSGATGGFINPVTGGTGISKTFNLGTTTCTYRIDDDGAGPHLPVLQVFTVTVNDNTDPVFAAAPNTLNIGTVNCFAPVTLVRSATDNCDSSPSISFTIETIPPGGPLPTLDNPAMNNGNASGTYPVGIYTVTFTAMDNFPSNNTATHVVTVTVADNIDPVAVCKDIMVSLDANGNVTVQGMDLDDGVLTIAP